MIRPLLTDEQKRIVASDSKSYKNSDGGRIRQAEDELRKAACIKRVFTMGASQIMTNPEVIVEAVATHNAIEQFWKDIDNKIEEGRRAE
jgi:hypothetical protein